MSHITRDGHNTQYWKISEPLHAIVFELCKQVTVTTSGLRLDKQGYWNLISFI